MKDQFVTYAIAKRLKELGFNEPCFGAYDAGALMAGNEVYIVKQKTFGYTNKGTFVSCAAPLWQQAIEFVHMKLDQGRANVKFKMYADGSGEWIIINDDNVQESRYQFYDDNVQESRYKFYDKNDAITKALELIK